MDENKKYKKMIGETIYRLRKEKGLTQAELGELAGVSNKAVSKWETDEANHDISIIPVLAKSLGVTSDELLNDLNTEKNGFTEPVSADEELSVKNIKMGGAAAKRKKRKVIIISGISAAVVLIVFLSVFFTVLTG